MTRSRSQIIKLNLLNGSVNGSQTLKRFKSLTKFQLTTCVDYEWIIITILVCFIHIFLMVSEDLKLVIWTLLCRFFWCFCHFLTSVCAWKFLNILIVLFHRRKLYGFKKEHPWVSKWWPLSFLVKGIFLEQICSWWQTEIQLHFPSFVSLNKLGDFFRVCPFSMPGSSLFL